MSVPIFKIFLIFILNKRENILVCIACAAENRNRILIGTFGGRTRAMHYTVNFENFNFFKAAQRDETRCGIISQML